MAENDNKSFLDELKESMEKVQRAVLDGLEQAENEVTRFFEALESEAEEVVEEVREEEPEAEASEPAATSELGEKIEEVVDEARAILEDAADEFGERWEVLEAKIREVIVSTLDSLDVSSDDVISHLKSRVEDLERAFDELKKEEESGWDEAGEADVEIRSIGGGWYEIVVGGEVIDKVQGKEHAEQVAGAFRDRKDSK